MTVQRDAERAVIGAVLLEPERFAEVREWLEPGDFDGIAERVVYETMVAMANDGKAISPEALHESLRVRTTNRHVAADAPFLVTCMQQCPSAERAAVYGRMVLEMSVRRQISDSAIGLRQRAAGSSDLTRVFASVDTARREIESLHHREATASGAFAPTPINAEGLPAPARRRSPAARSTECLAVLSLIEHPAALDVVKEWLTTEDFRDDECSRHFGELLFMRETRVPVDRVTLSWALAQHGVASELAAHGEKVPACTEPITAARRVLQQSVRSTVVDTAIAVEEGMNQNQGFPATAVAYKRLNALWPEQRRLVAADRGTRM